MENKEYRHDCTLFHFDISWCLGVLVVKLLRPGVMLFALALNACAPPPATDVVTVVPKVPTSQPTPATMQSLRESFDTADVGKLHVGSVAKARFAIDSGRYTITVTDTNTLVWSTVGGPLADGSAETEIFFDQGTPTTAAGILFRMQDDQNFYVASLSSDGFYALDAREQGAWRSIIEWTPWPTIDTRGGANRLQVLTKGTTISLYLDGALLAQTVDKAFADGDLALAVNTFDTRDVSVRFDNLVVQPMIPAATKE